MRLMFKFDGSFADILFFPMSLNSRHAPSYPFLEGLLLLGRDQTVSRTMFLHTSLSTTNPSRGEETRV